jgi:hypothetical protein
MKKVDAADKQEGNAYKQKVVTAEISSGIPTYGEYPKGD